MDRETVITHLQIIHTWAAFAYKRDLQFFTAKHLEDIAKWTDDALNLLKKQEARLMTLDEIKAFNWDYCYLEEERLPGKVYRTVCGNYALTCITWPCIVSMRIQYGDDSYGKKWRCWTSRPTDKQREEVKWK